jgi:hypothetical protein
MIFLHTTINVQRTACVLLLALLFLWSPQAQSTECSTGTIPVADTALPAAGESTAAAVPFSFGLYSITEGMNDYPIQKQLTNTLPLSLDFSIIFCIGWTGDKLYIKLTDDGGDGDRLQGIALAQYEGWEIVPYWSTVYSTTAHDSCEIIIPVYPPAITVYLISGYWGISAGENPYSYTITLSFPQ